MMKNRLFPLLLTAPLFALFATAPLDGSVFKKRAPQLTQATTQVTPRLPMAAASSMVTFCDPGNANSTGLPTQLTGNFGTGYGSGLHLEMTQGPPFQLGYLLVGEDFVDPGVASGMGELCLSFAGGNLIGRYNLPGTPMNSLGRFDASGTFINLVGTSSVGTGFDVPLSVPRIGGTVYSGLTLSYQLFHREANGDFNLSNGLAVTF